MRRGNPFIARSPTKASPVSSRTLTDPGEWPGVGMILPGIPKSAKESSSSPKDNIYIGSRDMNQRHEHRHDLGKDSAPESHSGRQGFQRLFKPVLFVPVQGDFSPCDPLNLFG